MTSLTCDLADAFEITAGEQQRICHLSHVRGLDNRVCRLEFVLKF